MTEKLFVNFSNLKFTDGNDSNIIIFVRLILTDKDKNVVYKVDSEKCSRPYSCFLEM